MSGTLTPSGGINDVRTQALLSLSARLGNLDLTQLLVYVIANVPSTALPFLAWQFDVLSPFWQLLKPGSSQAQLIQQSISLHRVLGTPYAITTAISNLGWNVPIILEGQNSWGGNTYPSNEGWAVFRVYISKTTLDGQPISVSSPEETQAVDAVLFFKPARCVLDSLWFVEPPLSEPPLTIVDSFTLSLGPVQVEPPIVITDFPTVIGWILFDYFNPPVLHNKIYFHSNSVFYSTFAIPNFVSAGPIVANGVVVADK
jgi:hypothetical protein